jgi:nitrogen fixation NifU-like protein
MTDALKGKTVDQARALFEAFHAMITSDPTTPLPDLSSEARRAKVELGKLSVFSGVREFPTRIKCASLAWHTMKAAVADPSTPLRASDTNAPVSTE